MLAFLLLLKFLYSDLWNIVGLHGDKNGNPRPRQPGGKDAHGKLQGLLRSCSVRWGIGLASWGISSQLEMASGALC